MLQSIGNSVVLYIGCLVSAVRQDQGIRVAHCDAVSGELQHKKIVRAVAECIGVFDRNPKRSARNRIPVALLRFF